MKRKNIKKELIFTILLFLLSPIMIPIVIICTLLALIYWPIEKITYEKNNSFLGSYSPLITIKKNREIKTYKYLCKQKIKFNYNIDKNIFIIDELKTIVYFSDKEKRKINDFDAWTDYDFKKVMKKRDIRL